MAQNQDKPTLFQAKLCIKCTDMYGHPNFNDMCSACFKKEKTQQKLQQLKKEEPEPEPIQTPKNLQIKDQEQELDNKKRGPPLPPQEPKGKCAKCDRKTKMLGYDCKHCNNEFCRLHRLPQDHDCQVDFVTLGRKQIKRDNPTVSHRKIQHI